MIRGKTAIGAISVVRAAPGPLSEKQRELLKTFAAQAVIAIENTRLLNELRQRTDDLSESLQQQTATTDVLKVISSSPGELEPVFNAMLENAVRICQAKFGVMHRFVGEEFYAVARLNIPQPLDDFLRERGQRKAIPGSDLDNLYKSKQVVHTIDMLAAPVPSRQACRGADATCRADVNGRRVGRGDCYLPAGGPSIHGQANRAGSELRCAGRHRD
jgi:two-component system, NtrC family, sensor kinase